MMESPYRIRPAVASDADQIRKNIKLTLANPEGRSVRKNYREAAERSELLVLERFDNKERVWEIEAFVDWHTRIDGSMNIRDAGSIGEGPQEGIIKRLIRELLRLQSPPMASVKVRADQPLWNGIFEEIPGFQQDGKEYSRPYWRNIWTWSREAAQAAATPPRIRQPRPGR